ncbi:MAG: ABC transporter permease subunit [Actinobacteria bacterium]|nr:ABC transporter permease subunit [Actinomycetota bacterium]
MMYQASKTLPYRVEMYRQIKRKRTLFSYLFVISLPVIVALAVKFGTSGKSTGPTRFGSGTADLIGLATNGAANFTATMFYFATPFLLVAVISIFNGDTVASEASWSTLRYLLAAPVPRIRLLVQKLKVSLTLSGIGIILLSATSWAVGTITFGLAPLQTPLGATFHNGVAISRLFIVAIYLSISLLAVAGLAFYLSVATDVPLGAVGGAIGIMILSNILDAITGLGAIRNWLPTHYSFSWFDAMAPSIDWTAMIRGASYSLILFFILISLAMVKFAKKDVTS